MNAALRRKERTASSGLEKAIYGDAQDAEGALIFEAFGRFVEFLQAQFGIFIELVIVQKLANAALAPIDLLHDGTHVRHHGGGFIVESIVGGELPKGALARVDFVDEVPGIAEDNVDMGDGFIRVGHQILDVRRSRLEIRRRPQRGFVERVV
jgi:hypothetical protein